VAVGGNLGTPALDLLNDTVELYVIEASSFQLERSDALNADVAVILNITPDHMDRYKGIQDYHQAKHRIFRGCRLAIFNRDDVLTRPLLAKQVEQLNFGLSQPDIGQFGTSIIAGEQWLTFGSEKLIKANDLNLVGKHHSENALAALAVSKALHLNQDKALSVIKQFSGLPHRCQEVLNSNNVRWINDSKGTNVGAAIAAINGLAHKKNIIWLAGGEGKGADFSALLPVVKAKVKHSILMGKSAQNIADVLVDLPVTIVSSMQEAIILANTLAQENDLVLLSPACASFDWYKNYEHRGNDFTNEVKTQIAEATL
jgi:UDP-N-acetylmuramoylalanine--D-glutamate ligase